MIKIALFEPEKPANTGNIIRLCMALNCHLAIIGEPSFSLTEKAFRRASMDYIIGFDIERYKDIDIFLEKHMNFEGYFSTRYSKNIYTENDYSDTKKDYFFMFGKESSGIPKEILKKYYEKTIRIPMAINARSLNLADSVAIVISECLRQQNFPDLSTRETIKGQDFLSNY